MNTLFSKVITLITLLCFIPILSIGQVNIDSIYQKVQDSKDPDIKIEQYKELLKALAGLNHPSLIDRTDELMAFAEKTSNVKGKAIGFEFKGYYNLITGNVEGAIVDYTKSNDHYSELSDYQGMVKTKNNLSICYERLGQMDEVLKFSKEALKIATESDQPKILADAHKRLGEIHGYLIKDVEKGLKYIEKAMAIYKEAGDEIMLAKTLLSKGSILATVNSTEALETFHEAELLAEKQNQKGILVYIRQSLVYLYHSEGRLSEAIETVNKNLKDAKASSDVTNIAIAHIRLGELYSSLHHESKPLEHYNKALEYAREANLTQQIIGANFGKGLFYHKQGKVKEAITHFKRSRLLSDSIQNNFLLLQALPELGSAYLDDRQLEKGKNCFLKMIELAEEGNSTVISTAKARLGQYHYFKGNNREARVLLNDGYRFADESNNVKLKSTMANFLASVEKDSKNFKKSLYWKEIELGLMEDLNLADNQEKMTTLRLSAEFEKEKEILALQNEKEKAELKAKQARAYTLGGGALLALLGASIFLWILRRRNQKITEQKQSLERLNTVKDRLFQIIGHDLKKPSIAFKGIAKNIDYLIENGDTKRLSQLGQEINSDATRFYNLTDNLLNWASTQKDLISLKPENIGLYDMVQENIDLFEAISKRKNITIQNNLSSEQVIYADKNTLSTIVRNLLDNAIKFTPNNGNITIQNKSLNNQLALEVIDSGVGLEAGKVDEILNRDFILSEVGTQNEKGSGLGLSIVKKLVKQLNGKLHIESALGEGSRFIVMLPKEIALAS